MNLKKRLKKFFTLNRSANDGFTLVELIVVIAILGILAGVGTVAYSGYIKKAQTAADEILLDSLNTAFAAACIENGKDVNSLTASQATATVTGVITPSEYQDEFDKYYEGGEFKVYTSLVFRDGLFEGVADGVELDYNGHKIVVSQETIKLLQESSYAEIEADVLLGTIDDLTGLFEGDLTALGDDYLKAFAAYMDVSVDGSLTGYDLQAAVFSALNDSGKVDGLSEDDLMKMMANGVVLYAAQNTTTMNESLIADALAGNLSANTDEKLAQAALVYGLYTGYMDGNVETSDPMSVVRTVVHDDGFKKYMNSDEGKADQAAYLAALKTISDTAADSDTAYSILADGFDNNADMEALLAQLLGQ